MVATAAAGAAAATEVAATVLLHRFSLFVEPVPQFTPSLQEAATATEVVVATVAAAAVAVATEAVATEMPARNWPQSSPAFVFWNHF